MVASVDTLFDVAKRASSRIVPAAAASMARLSRERERPLAELAPLPSPELPPRLKRYNQLIARRRAAVETTFATLKRRMGLSAIRYVGLTKASGQVLMAAMAFNLRRWATLSPA